MRNLVFILFALISCLAFWSEAATPRFTQKSVLETVKKNPHLRAYYSKDEKGRKVLVVTNRTAAGNNNKRIPRTAAAVPASHSKSIETLTRIPIRQEPQV